MPRHRRPPNFDDIVRQLKRRRMYLRAGAAGVVLVLLLTVLGWLGVFGHPGDDWKDLDQQTVRVTRVIDGDTVVVVPENGGQEETVRLLGIDAPELRSKGGTPEHWSKQATNYLIERAEGKLLILKLGPTQTRDRWRRLLGYLYVDDAINLNLDMVRDGQVYAHRVYKHTRKAEFEQAENEARKKKRGLWKDVKGDQMPVWRQRWLADREVRNESGAGN